MTGEISREVETVFTAARRTRVLRVQRRHTVAMVQIKCKGSSEEKYSGENKGGI